VLGCQRRFGSLMRHEIQRRVTHWISLISLTIAIFTTAIWCSLAIWFRCGASKPVCELLSGAFLALAVVTIGCLATYRRWLVLAVYSAAFVFVVAWWTTIKPSNDRNWAPETARSATGTIVGDRLVLNNVRNFTWRSDTDFDKVWEQRAYDLSLLTDVDLIMSYWAGEAIAHTIVSFGFGDRSRLAFSIEIRKEQQETYSPIAGFFKQYELAIVAADERDVVRLRSNVRGEDVRMYRLRMTPENTRLLLREYVNELNKLARKPRFYNTLTANCTTVVFDMVQVVHPGLSMDPRILLSGYLPNYVYDLGATVTNVPFAELRERSRIHDKAAQANMALDFSALIREGIPSPRR
jgi:hypothetical protein